MIRNSPRGLRCLQTFTSRSFARVSGKTDVDVLIVGAGPVGMVLSTMLDSFNISNKMLEQSGDPFVEEKS